MFKLEKINFKQPKYMIPLIIYIPVLFTAYFIFDMFDTDLAEAPSNLETTEYLNDKLPTANIKDDGIGKRYDNLVKSYGGIQDFSAVENIDVDGDVKKKEEYQSKYTSEDIARLEEESALQAAQLDSLQQMEQRIQNGMAKGKAMGGNEQPMTLSESDRMERSRRREKEAMDELNKELAKARLAGQKGLSAAKVDSTGSNGNAAGQPALKGKVALKSQDDTEGAVKSIDDEAEAKEVVKLTQAKSDYFNTIAENDPVPNLIKAIIDENISAVDGSRVRLRLLDDVKISEVVLKKGSYVYAIMSGFGQQRVKGNVLSILVEDELVKVNLSLYDTDGMEGLYVPSSKFRETAKNVASSAMSGNMAMNSGSTGNSLQQWGLQALTNAYQKTTNAISSAVKQNRVKLKYGSQVYLVNGREKREK